MIAVIVSLLPVIAGATVLPLEIIMALPLLRSNRGVIKAMSFAAGATTVRALKIIFFGYVFHEAEVADDRAGSHLIASSLLLLVGISLLITMAKAWHKNQDPDAPSPKWMTVLCGASPAMTFGLGALLMVISVKQWVFTISAIAVISEARLNQAGDLLAYIFFVIAAYSLVLVPIIYKTVAPVRSAKFLEAAQTWLTRHNRKITIATSCAFGVWFVFKGASGLLNHPAELRTGLL